jgi:DNA-binding response OmpR family regulator
VTIVTADRSLALPGSLVELRPRILIVDDDPASILILQSHLAGVDSEVRAVTESKDAERAFHEFAPDLVLLDLHMPGLDGLDILRRLQPARDSLGFVPVIVLTADETTKARNTALVLGANDFLTKPPDRVELVLRVRNLLRTRQLFLRLGSLEDNP